ncbi:hypothetical protein A1D22_04300 [Pasteurellaceae bacterium LFhippo2]|nr:hypothetical protein [Pasteurellaceae bacterium LFhippo2]
MRKSHLFVALIVASIGIVACQQREPVEVVKAQDTSTIVQPKAPAVSQQLPDNLPANVTAICRDGSYSTATDSTACSGNGGVSSVINRYHSE